MNKVMKKQAIVNYGQPLVELVSEVPRPGEGEVLIKVGHCGVCHSDLHIHDGYFDLGGDSKLSMESDQSLPFNLGHEIQGAVAELGAGVDGVELGQSVAVYPWIGCGSCELCDSGREQLCTASRSLGCFVDGGFAEYVLVPDARYLLPIDDIDPKLAAVLMCSGLTAYSAIRKLEQAVACGDYLIMGAGGVGMMAVQFANALYDRAPMVADIDPQKLTLAESWGCASTYDLREKAAVKEIRQASGGGLSAVADFVGAETTVQQGLSLLKQGGQLVLVGLFGGTLSTPLPLIPMRSLTIQGSYVGSLAEAKAMLELVKQGAIATFPVSERPLCEANQALEDLRQGKVVGRVVLTP